MGYVKNMFRENTNLKAISKRTGTFTYSYDYWIEVLFERTMRLFKWEGTEVEGNNNVPAKEIEGILLMNGTAGVSRYKKQGTRDKKLAVFNGMFGAGPTVYYDEFEGYNIYSPVFSAQLTVGKDVVVMNNNRCRNSVYPLCHKYAVLLAHTEVSLVDTLINGRDSGGIPIASTEAQKVAIENYRNALCEGKVGAILDPAFSGVEFIGVSKNTALSIKDLMEVRQNLLDSFYNDIGVRTSKDKKGNMIVEEVEANDSMLLLNISDMLECRQKAAEEVNKMFGTNWSVKVADEIDYNKEAKDNGNGESKNIMEDSKAE